MEYRKLERDGYCRGCDKKIKRNDELVVAFYSHRNRGQYIYLCDNCIAEMSELVADDTEIKTREQWSKQEPYKYLVNERKDGRLNRDEWLEKVYECNI